MPRHDMVAGAATGGCPWVLVAILLLAFGLRTYRLGAQSLWYDETVSTFLASEPMPALVAHTAGDIHPPGYYLLLHAWIRLAGSSEFSQAFLSLFFGLLLVALAYRLAVQTGGKRAGLLAAFLVAISPYNLWYSQEVRMYTLGAAVGMGLLSASLPLLTREPAKAPAWPRLALVAALGALGLWVLYYFAFLLAAMNLMVLGWWLAGWLRRQVSLSWLGRWAVGQGLVLLLYAPWLPVAWRQATQPPVPPWRGFTSLGDVALQTWSALSLGQSAEVRRVWPALVLVAVLYALGVWGLGRGWTRGARSTDMGGGWRGGVSWVLAGYTFLPVVLIYLVSLLAPLYHVRYAFTYSTPFYVVLGAGLAVVERWRRPALWAALAVLVAFSGMSIATYHTEPRYAADDHRAAVRFVADRWRPGDAILVNAGYVYTALTTYWDGEPIGWRGRLGAGPRLAETEGPALFQTGTVGGEPSLGWGDPDSDFFAISAAETEAALGRLFADYHRVWVYRCYDTVTDPDGMIRRWLEEHGTLFEDQVFAGEANLRVQGYLTDRDPLDDADAQVGADLADGSLRLLARQVGRPAVAVGSRLDIVLVWQVGGQLERDITLFVGLVDEAGQRWAQADEHPLGSLLRVSDWPPGAAIRTPLRVEIPTGVPPGKYRLEVGWYYFVDGRPVWLPWTTGNLLGLGDVDVTAPEAWGGLSLPVMEYCAGVEVGPGVELLGMSAPTWEVAAGRSLEMDLYWRALYDAPEAGLSVLQLRDATGQVVAEASSGLAGGRAAFVSLAAGQTVRDPRSLEIPSSVSSGVYEVIVGRRRSDGAWLSIRRGLFRLGPTYRLATVRVTRQSAREAPE